MNKMNRANKISKNKIIIIIHEEREREKIIKELTNKIRNMNEESAINIISYYNC